MTTGKIANGVVTSAKLTGATVRSNSAAIAANSNATVISGCNAGEQIFGIGYIWNTADAALNLRILNQFFFANAAAVRARNGTGAARTLTVQALCLGN